MLEKFMLKDKELLIAICINLGNGLERRSEKGFIQPDPL